MDRDERGGAADRGGCQDPSQEVLSVGEAALRYGVPKRKISKLLEQNQLDGARKVRGLHGVEWRVPASELEERGYRRTEQPVDEHDPQVAELQRSVRALTDALVLERQRWEDKHRELEDALLVIGQLKAELRREQERREAAESALDGAALGPGATGRTIDLRGEPQPVQQSPSPTG